MTDAFIDCLLAMIVGGFVAALVFTAIGLGFGLGMLIVWGLA